MNGFSVELQISATSSKRLSDKVGLLLLRWSCAVKIKDEESASELHPRGEELQ